jgi:hypothetical protein
MEAPQNESDGTIQFLVGDSVIHFAGICHSSDSVQKLFKNFMCVQWLKFFFHLLRATLTRNIFFVNFETPKGTTLRKSASIDACWSRWLLPFGL